jgi:cyclopropane fatty-acyl-phospholipid synthase-like methyltransferase
MNLLSRFFYTWLYLGRPPWDTGVTPPEVVAFVQTHPPGRALDLGCGTGTNTIYLAQHGWQATGVDFVGRAIRSARRKARRAGVQVDFQQGDVTRLDGIQGPFDLVLDIGCYHSLTEEGKAAYLQNLQRMLAPQGTYLLYALFKTSPEQRTGLLEADLELLDANLHRLSRQDGTDRSRRSVWLAYENLISLP